MWENRMTALLLSILACLAIPLGPSIANSAYVYFFEDEYRLSLPEAETRHAPDKLPAEVGKAILERLLDPAHMLVTGLGEAGNATLRIGDSAKAELFAALGPAKALPLGLKTERDFGYVSTRAGDSTVIVVGMGNSAVDNPNFVVNLHVCFSPLALPKKYRPALKDFFPTPGVHSGLATQSGLRLGLSRTEVEEIFGKPLWRQKNFYVYGALGDVQLSPEFLITRWNWPKDVQSKLGGIDHRIQVWFVGGRVSAFHIGRLYDL